MDGLRKVAEIAKTSAGAARIESPSQTPKGTAREGEYKQMLTSPLTIGQGIAEGIHEGDPLGGIVKGIGGGLKDAGVPVFKGYMARKMVDPAVVDRLTSKPSPWGQRSRFSQFMMSPLRVPRLPGALAASQQKKENK